MEFTGKVVGISQDYSTGAYTISFRVNEAERILHGYDGIKDVEKLAVSVKKWRKKRSLDANAYAWVLMSKIADALATSKDEVYEEMLRRYGFFYETAEGVVNITVKSNVNIGNIPGHWSFLEDNGKFKAYAMIKGSSEYDTREMSRFIQGIVSEAKELGIETLTPAELEQMMKEWKA